MMWFEDDDNDEEDDDDDGDDATCQVTLHMSTMQQTADLIREMSQPCAFIR